MSTSMVSTVLEIEREAEAILKKAEADAKAALAQAKTQCEESAASRADALKRELADMEQKAAAERAGRVKELAAAGEADLAAVQKTADASFDKAVQFLMGALSKK